MSELLFKQPIIANENIKNNFKTHKFTGGDFSLFYRYVASPICDKLVLLIPLNIA